LRVAVALLWVIAVDLLARFADLLDDEERRMPLDDELDRRVFVTGNHDEAVPLLDDTLVGRWGNLDRLDTGCASAFAMERQRRRDSMLLRAFVDVLVDPAKGFFVTGCSLRKFHVG
jgi:hypothetical protein